MKKLIAVLSAVAAVAGSLLLAWSLRESVPAEAVPLGGHVNVPATAQVEPVNFVELPVGQPRTVDFAADKTALEQLTLRERRDQFRDWLLFAAASAAGLSPEQFNQSLYDLPALRHGYMRPVANLDYGESRSCTIGEGHVLALVPAGEGPRHEALVAEILDAQRKNLGSEPKTVTVVDYELDQATETARLTRRADVAAQTYFERGSNYQQRTINTLDDLAALLNEVDDLTYATLQGGSLILGGRKVADHRYKGITPQDVAAVWQAETKLHVELTAWETRLKTAQDEFNAETRRQSNVLETKWKGIFEAINDRLRLGLARKKTALDFETNLRTPAETALERLVREMNERERARAHFGETAMQRALREMNKREGKPTTDPFFRGTETAAERRARQFFTPTGRDQPFLPEAAPPPFEPEPKPLNNDLDFTTATVVDEDEVHRREKVDFDALKAQRDQDWTKLMEQIAREESGRRPVKGSGFSLDPDYDFPGLAGMLETFVAEVEGFGAGQGASAVPATELSAAIAALKSNNRGPFDTLIDRLNGSGGALATTLAAVFASAERSSLAETEADIRAHGEVMTGLASDLDRLRDGRWPDDTPADLAAIRRALDGGDETPLRAWLNHCRKGPGVLARAAYSVVATADHRTHGVEIIDRPAFEGWLRSIEQEARAWSQGVGPAHEVRVARESLSRGNDLLLRSMIERWSEGESVLGRALAGLLVEWTEGARSKGAPDFTRQDRALARVERGMMVLTSGEGAPLAPSALNATLSRGDLGLLANLDAWPRAGDIDVRDWVGTWLARDSTRFRNCDRQALSSYLAETASWAKTTATDANSLLNSETLRKFAARPNRLTSVILEQQAQLSGNPFTVAIGEQFSRSLHRFEEPNLNDLASTLERYAPWIATLSTELSLDELRDASQSLSRESRATQGRGKDADQAVVPLLKWTRHIGKSTNPMAQAVAKAVDRESHRYRFQMARYDGDLKGTEVGMILFYTDLLAKLWAIDFLHNQPAREVEDFHPMTDLRVSPVFEAEIRRLPSTRLWFGPEDKGFQVADNGNTLFLARNATRIYAASSDPLAPGKEEAAAADSEAFLGWWNDHYIEVARFEPEYEQLNEVMKWSLLISWLNDRNKGDALGFLSNVSVDHTNWFPEWVVKHPDLRFRRWEKVAFYGPGYNGATTEAMPILSSDPYPLFGDVLHLSGGVSLAPKELFKTRTALTGEISPLLRRSNLNYGSRALTGEGLTFKTLQESQFTFKNPGAGRSLLEAAPKAGTKLRGRVTEITTPTFERTVTRQSGALEIATRVADHDLAVLSVQPTKNGLRVGLRGRELAQGQSLAARASTSYDPLAAIVRHPEVEVAVNTSDALFVRTRGGKDWIKLKVEVSEPGLELKPEGVARVADTKPGAHTYDVAFVDDAAVKTALSGSEDLVIRVPERPADAYSMSATPRGPPPDGPSIPVEIETSSGTVRGRFNSKTRGLTLDPKDLPPALLDDPAKLTSLVKRSGLGRLTIDPNQTATARLTVKELSIEESAFVRDLDEGRYSAAAKELADNPSSFARKLSTEYEGTLRSCDELLKGGAHDRALSLLNRLEDVYGARPEVRFRQAICEIERGQTARAARLGNEALESRGGLSKLHEEVNARLASIDLDGPTRSNLAAFRDGAAWRELQASGKLPSGKLELVGEGERLNLEYHASQPFPQGKPAAVEQVFASNAPIYVVDTPGLNNLDWSTSFRPTLESQVQGKLATVVSIPDAGIAEFHPTKVFVGDTATSNPTYSHVRTNGIGSHPHSSYGPARSNGSPGGSDEDDEKKKRRLAELLRNERIQALQKGQENPTGEFFLIIPAGAK